MQTCTKNFCRTHDDLKAEAYLMKFKEGKLMNDDKNWHKKSPCDALVIAKNLGHADNFVASDSSIQGVLKAGSKQSVSLHDEDMGMSVKEQMEKKKVLLELHVIIMQEKNIPMEHVAVLGGS